MIIKQYLAVEHPNSFDSHHLSPTNRTTTPVANVSEHIGSNANAGNHISEINKNLERQRVLQEQMNKIKSAKKNFHAVLLKDAKCKENIYNYASNRRIFEDIFF